MMIMMIMMMMMVVVMKNSRAFGVTGPHFPKKSTLFPEEIGPTLPEEIRDLDDLRRKGYIGKTWEYHGMLANRNVWKSLGCPATLDSHDISLKKNRTFEKFGCTFGVPDYMSRGNRTTFVEEMRPISKGSRPNFQWMNECTSPVRSQTLSVNSHANDMVWKKINLGQWKDYWPINMIQAE